MLATVRAAHDIATIYLRLNQVMKPVLALMTLVAWSFLTCRGAGAPPHHFWLARLAHMR
jgi:hypothetical protein